MSTEQSIELAQQLIALLQEHEPSAMPFLRELYNAGLIPGARALQAVTVGEQTHGTPPWPGREVTVAHIPNKCQACAEEYRLSGPAHVCQTVEERSDERNEKRRKSGTRRSTSRP